MPQDPNTPFKLAKRIPQPPQDVVHLNVSVFTELGVAVRKNIDLAFHRVPRLDQFLDMCRSIFFHLSVHRAASCVDGPLMQELFWVKSRGRLRSCVRPLPLVLMDSAGLSATCHPLLPARQLWVGNWTPSQLF
jgi:hypothetical protein